MCERLLHTNYLAAAAAAASNSVKNTISRTRTFGARYTHTHYTYTHTRIHVYKYVLAGRDGGLTSYVRSSLGTLRLYTVRKALRVDKRNSAASVLPRRVRRRFRPDDRSDDSRRRLRRTEQNIHSVTPVECFVCSPTRACVCVCDNNA